MLSGGAPLTASAVGDGALQVLASGALTAAISVGLAALFGARGMVMGVVLAVFLGHRSRCWRRSRRSATRAT